MLAKLSGTLLVSFGCVPKSFEDFNIYMQFGKGSDVLCGYMCVEWKNLGCALFMTVCEVDPLLFIIPATVSVWGDPLDLFVVKLLAVPKFLE